MQRITNRKGANPTMSELNLRIDTLAELLLSNADKRSTRFNILSQQEVDVLNQIHRDLCEEYETNLALNTGPTFLTRLHDLMQAENLTYAQLEAEEPRVAGYVKKLSCVMLSVQSQEILDDIISVMLPCGVLWRLALRFNVNMEWLAFGTGPRVRDNDMRVVVETLHDENEK